MKKILFEQEVDFLLPISYIVIPSVGDVEINTRKYGDKLYAKFIRFSPNTWVETSIEEWLTGVRLQYMVQDDLIRKTISINPDLLNTKL